MKDIILIIIYLSIFILELYLIRTTLKKKKLNLWIITYIIEIISIVASLILMIYYLQPNSYFSQTKNENLYAMISFNIYTLTFFITFLIGMITKYKKKKASKNN